MKLIRIYFRLLFKYLKFYFRANTVYDLHSPFLVAFTHAVIEDRRFFYAFSFAEDTRNRLKQSSKKVPIVELGAGSLVSSDQQRSIQNIAHYSAIPPIAGRHLFRIVNHFKPEKMVELGTSLGISTIYQAFGNYEAELITIEGNPHLQAYSRQAFTNVNLSNIKQLQGSFKEQLPIALKQLKKLDYLFIDGDHRMEQTLSYFNACLEYLHNDSIVIIADIHWSDEMEVCWKTLQEHPSISASIDLFHLGVLFLKKEIKEEQHFSLIKASWKPWRLGFFYRK